MRSRVATTGVVFALELTHDVNALLPLLVAVTIAHGFTVLALRRSILTEKVSRRGYHLTREYAIDPLEILFVREVMRRNIVALPADIGLEALHHSLRAGAPRRQQLLYPVIDPESRLVGVVTRTDLQQLLDGHRAHADGPPLSPLIEPTRTVAYPDEPLRVVVYRWRRPASPGSRSSSARAGSWSA